MVKFIPFIPQHVVPDLYTQAEKRVDKVDEVISRIPLVDNGAAADDGAITIQVAGFRTNTPKEAFFFMGPAWWEETFCLSQMNIQDRDRERKFMNAGESLAAYSLALRTQSNSRCR